MEEITSTNTPKRTETSPITGPTGSEVTVTTSTPRATTSPLVGSTPRRTQSWLTSPSLTAALPVAQAEANFRYGI